MCKIKLLIEKEKLWYFFIVLFEFLSCLRQNMRYFCIEFMRWLTRNLRGDILAFHHIESKCMCVWSFFFSAKTGVMIQRLSMACSMNCSESFSHLRTIKKRDNYTKWNETKKKKRSSTEPDYTLYFIVVFSFLFVAFMRTSDVLNTLNAIFIVL